LKTRFAATSTVFEAEVESVLVLLPATASVLTSALPCRPVTLPPVFVDLMRAKTIPNDRALITSGFETICDGGAITPFTPRLVSVCVAGRWKSSAQTRSLALRS